MAFNSDCVSCLIPKYNDGPRVLTLRLAWLVPRSIAMAVHVIRPLPTMPVLFVEFAHRSLNATTTPSVSDPSNQRNVWDIIWSCVMTIFACTWVAIHPNIPAISDSDIVVALRRTGLMLCGLVAPEIIILWAMKQWYSARIIGQRHAAKGWTTTHGHFLQMGGFMLYSEGKPTCPLDLEEMEYLHSRGDIQWPQITESEILDKSKGDALSKGIVTLQTSWFLLQCIIRGSCGLVITELELLTLAFATLNVMTYFFWWNKPVDIRYPHPVNSIADSKHAVSDNVMKNFDVESTTQPDAAADEHTDALPLDSDITSNDHIRPIYIDSYGSPSPPPSLLDSYGPPSLHPMSRDSDGLPSPQTGVLMHQPPVLVYERSTGQPL